MTALAIHTKKFNKVFPKRGQNGDRILLLGQEPEKEDCPLSIGKGRTYVPVCLSAITSSGLLSAVLYWGEGCREEAGMDDLNRRRWQARVALQND